MSISVLEFLLLERSFTNFNADGYVHDSVFYYYIYILVCGVVRGRAGVNTFR